MEIKKTLRTLLLVALCAGVAIAVVIGINKAHDNTKPSKPLYTTPVALGESPSRAIVDSSVGSILRNRIPALDNNDSTTLVGIAQAVCTDYRRGASFVGAVDAVKLMLSLNESDARKFVDSAAGLYCPEYIQAGKSG